MSILIEGMPIDDVIQKLKGNPCRNGTSCTDQLVKALESYKNDNK
ncbi:MAG: TSCPD domain-containing protein [Pelosinus sp.]|nr:TSCPD domain-containing protein [Pelosinus sp.]